MSVVPPQSPTTSTRYHATSPRLLSQPRQKESRVGDQIYDYHAAVERGDEER